MGRTCPPNTFCLSNEFMMILIGVLSILLVVLYVNRGQQQQQSHPIIIQNEATTRIPSVIATERARAPQPLRDWMNGPEYPPRGGIATIPINIPTQGLPEAFQFSRKLAVCFARINAEADRIPVNAGKFRC